MKTTLREQARKQRDKVNHPQKGLELRDNFIKNIELPPRSVVSAYWPIGSEIDVRPLMIALYDHGHHVCLPCITAENEPLSFRMWEPEAVMVKSRFKLHEPCHQHHEEANPTILITPLLAFDKSLHRLGYGGGYYDRTIKKLRDAGTLLMAIGVACQEQMIEKIPDEEWDMRLDKVVTELAVHS